MTEENLIPDDISEAYNEATFNVLREKTKGRYLKEKDKFSRWMKSRNVHEVTEDVVVDYFNELMGRQYAPPSLWSTYSMLRSTLFIYEKVDISKFKTLVTTIKNKSKGYQPKQAKAFQQRELEKFLNEAPDEYYLLMKVIVLMGVLGACRCEELLNLKTTDIEDKGSLLIVNISNSKIYKTRSFIITKEKGKHFNGLEIYRKYAALRPSSLGAGRFFLGYRAGKCTLQPVGINTFAKIPKLVAKYLKLKDADLYTGHCFRRTSASLLSNVSADSLTIMQQPGWQSSSLADNYVDEPVDDTIEIGKINNSEECTSSETVFVKSETEATAEVTTMADQFSLAERTLGEFKMNADQIKDNMWEMKCSVCNNFLSVPPVSFSYSAEGLQHKCGRCKGVPGSVYTRNTFFEDIAQHYTFPCIFENCGETCIPWPDVAKHEEKCLKRMIVCPLSDQCIQQNLKMTIKELEYHINDRHVNITQRGNFVTIPLVTVDDTMITLHNSKLIRKVLYTDDTYILVFIYENWFIVASLSFPEIPLNFYIKFEDMHEDLGIFSKLSIQYEQKLCVFSETQHCVKCLTNSGCEEKSHIRFENSKTGIGRLYVNINNIMSIADNKNLFVTIGADQPESNDDNNEMLLTVKNEDLR